MRALGPRLILFLAVLTLVFFVHRAQTPLARTASQDIGWAVTTDLPSASTLKGWLAAVGLPLPQGAQTTNGGVSGVPAALPQIVWPMAGAVVTPFGPVKDPKTGLLVDHTMVEIEAPSGTPVRSATNGIVMGKAQTAAGAMVTVRDGPYTLVYRGLGALKVKEGAAVTAGEVLGLLYHQGPGDTAILGFEVEAGSVPVNPASLLGGGQGS